MIVGDTAVVYTSLSSVSSERLLPTGAVTMGQSGNLQLLAGLRLREVLESSQNLARADSKRGNESRRLTRSLRYHCCLDSFKRWLGGRGGGLT